MIGLSIALLVTTFVSGAIFLVWTCIALFCMRKETLKNNQRIQETLLDTSKMGDSLQTQESAQKSYQDHLIMQVNDMSFPALKDCLQNFTKRIPLSRSSNTLREKEEGTMEQRV